MFSCRAVRTFIGGRYTSRFLIQDHLDHLEDSRCKKEGMNSALKSTKRSRPVKKRPIGRVSVVSDGKEQGLDPLIRLWDSGKGALLSETLLQLELNVWPKSWSHPEHHDLLTSIVCNYPDLLPQLIKEVVRSPKEAFHDRHIAVDLFSLIFTEIGEREPGDIARWLSHLAFFRQLCPPDVWSLDFLDNKRLDVRVAKQFVQCLSFGPRTARCDLLNAFLTDQYLYEKGHNTHSHLFAYAATGGVLSEEEMKTEMMRADHTSSGATQRTVCLAWIAYNNGPESTGIVKTCCQRINANKDHLKHGRRGSEVCSIEDAMLWYGLACSGAELMEVVVTLTHSVKPFGSPETAGKYLGGVLSAVPSRFATSGSKLLQLLPLALEPSLLLRLVSCVKKSLDRSVYTQRQLHKLLEVLDDMAGKV